MSPDTLNNNQLSECKLMPSLKNLGSSHQAVVICVDTSRSMGKPLEDGRKKCEIVEEMINGLANMDLSDYDKEITDICILSFDSMVRTIVDWQPLASFQGNIEFHVGDGTSLESAITTAIDKVKEIRKVYHLYGIISYRPQIFIYTDGTSEESLEVAYEKAQNYFVRTNNLAKMYITLFPPASNIKALSKFKKVTVMKIDDCVRGIPAAFDFLKAAISSTYCAWAEGKVILPVQDGISTLNQGDAKRNNKGRIVIETTIEECW